MTGTTYNWRAQLLTDGHVPSRNTAYSERNEHKRALTGSFTLSPVRADSGPEGTTMVTGMWFDTSNIGESQSKLLLIGLLGSDAKMIGSVTTDSKTLRPSPCVCSACWQTFLGERFLQGTFYGQKVFVADVESLDSLTILELDWSAGWQTHACSTWDLTATNLLMELVHAGWATFHIRLLLFESSTGFTHVERILREAPFSCEFFQQNYIVIEMSRLQCTRMGEMIPLAADT